MGENDEVPVTNLNRPERRRVFFYSDLGRFLGSVYVLIRCCWSEQEVVEEALRLRPDLADYEQVGWW